ncbi:MAG: hypothetical protein ABI333_27915, partial [bacterium]
SSGALTRRTVDNGQCRASSTLGLVTGFPGRAKSDQRPHRPTNQLARGSPLSTAGRGEPLKEARRRAPPWAACEHRDSEHATLEGDLS